MFIEKKKNDNRTQSNCQGQEECFVIKNLTIITQLM